MNSDVIRMVVAAVRIEGDDDPRPHIADHRQDRRLHFQQVDVGQGARIVPAEALLAGRIVEPEEARRVEPEDLARTPQFLGAMGAEIRNRSD